MWILYGNEIKSGLNFVIEKFIKTKIAMLCNSQLSVARHIVLSDLIFAYHNENETRL